MKLQIARNSLWLCYALRNPRLVQEMLPNNLEVAKVTPVEGITSCPMLMFNAYEINSTPWMNGARVDVQTFVRDKSTGTPHLVILDVLTDTRSWDPVNGLTGPNSVVTINESDGIDLKFEGKDRFVVKGSRGKTMKPNYTFIVEANRKCFFRNFRRGYEMNFDEDEVMKPVTELKNLQIENSAWRNVRGNLIISFKHNLPMQFHVNFNPMMLKMNRKLW